MEFKVQGGHRLNKLSALLLLLLLGTFTAQASTITFGSDLMNESNVHGSIIGSNFFIVPDPAWAPVLPHGNWISYANTGSGSGAISPPNTTIPGTPTAIFYEWLPLGTYLATLNIFADDTAGVFLEDASNSLGLLLKAPNPLQDGHCAAGQIGCEVNENWIGSFNVNPGGQARIRIEAYQRGGGPFGVMYQGTASTVPEPASYLLLGSSLIILGGVRKWRARKTN